MDRGGLKKGLFYLLEFESRDCIEGKAGISLGKEGIKGTISNRPGAFYLSCTGKGEQCREKERQRAGKRNLRKMQTPYFCHYRAKERLQTVP